jgi:hypothetical protein
VTRGERGRRAGLKPGLYKGEEGFLASLDMTAGGHDVPAAARNLRYRALHKLREARKKRETTSASSRRILPSNPWHPNGLRYPLPIREY